MRIPTLAVSMVAAAAIVALPTTAVAAAPVAVDDSAQTTREAPRTVDVLANDTGLDLGETHTVEATQPTHGEVTCVGSDCTYTPEDGWVGTDTFTYTVSDGVLSDTGTVTVTTVEISSILLGLTPASVEWSTAEGAVNTVKATGTVRQSSTVFLEGVEVELWHKPFGATEYTQVPGTTSDISNESGKVSWSGLEILSRTALRLQAAGNEVSSGRTVLVTPALNVDFSSKRHALGESFTVSGSSAPATEGDAVRLERLSATGTWDLVEEVQFGAVDSTTHAADFAFAPLTHEASGKFVYRVVVPDAERGREEATSNQVSVRTYDAEITNVEPSNSDEWVAVENTGDVTINLLGWRLSDDDTNLALPKRVLGPGDTVKIHSGRGANNANNLYLKKTDWFWANSGTVALRDDATPRVTLDEYTYPVVP